MSKRKEYVDLHFYIFKKKYIKSMKGTINQNLDSGDLLRLLR